MVKKKILIVNNNMEIGGIQKALLNLLHEICDDYDITLFLFNKSGELICDIPSSVSVKEGGAILRMLGMSCSEAKKTGRFYYLIRASFGAFSRLFTNRIPVFLCIHSVHNLSGYDAAISYMQNAGNHVFYGGANDFVLKKVKAERKITFLHCDFKNYDGNTEKNRKLYRNFDCITAVSESGKKAFLDCMPNLGFKTKYVYNCYDYNGMDKMAEQNTVCYEKEKFSIITVARLGEEKGIVRTVSVMKKLKEAGYDFCWHIIGDGACRRQIEEDIVSMNLEKYVMLHGKQENPYRFLKNADLLLVPSYHEGAPMVFFEAAHFGVPILSTNTSSAKEMVENNGFGFVCENSEKGIYEALIHILNDKEKLETLKKHMICPKDNIVAKKQFYDIIEKSN